MAVAAILLGWFIAGRVLRPLQTITTTVQQITATNLHRRLALDGPDDELRALGKTFDDLLARLETSFDAQRRFVANASHELRTPLTMMRTALDVATGKPTPPPPEVHVLAAKIRRGLDKADQLVESFLALARADHILGCPGRDRRSRPGRLRCARPAQQGHRRHGTQDRGTLQSAPVAGSEVLLARMVNNIIDNAVRHNEPNGWIRVVTSDRRTSARLIVETGGRLLDEQQVSRTGPAVPAHRRRAYRVGQRRRAWPFDRGGRRRRPPRHASPSGQRRRRAARRRRPAGRRSARRRHFRSTGVRVLVAEDVASLADDIAEGLQGSGIRCRCRLQRHRRRGQD